jgi:hypothetical protein
VIGCWWAGASCARIAAAEPNVTLIAPPQFGFFSKQVVCKGIPIKAHADVDDAALFEARRRMGRMLEHVPNVVANLVDIGAELHIIGKNKMTSDLPYLRHWKGKPFETYGKTFQSIDARTRGVGGLLASCGEENLLKLQSDRYRDHRDICTHEFAHTVLWGASGFLDTPVSYFWRAAWVSNWAGETYRSDECRRSAL